MNSFHIKLLINLVSECGPKVGEKYEIVDQKIDYVYNESDKVLFPRMSDYTQDRPKLYQRWTGNKTGTPTFGDNIVFFFRYQINWMYLRYFMAIYLFPFG